MSTLDQEKHTADCEVFKARLESEQAEFEKVRLARGFIAIRMKAV